MRESVRKSYSKDEYVELAFPMPWGTIAGKAWGDPCLPPVLMVHGIQDNAGTFDRILPMLPGIFYYVSIDLPGHGRSTNFPKGIFLNFMLYVSAIRRVIKHLKWTEYYYIGHSLGGQLGSYYTAMYPNEVKKLVMLDTLSQMIPPVDSFLKIFEEHNTQLMELESKMLSRNPPNYTYEEALSRLMNNRPTPITKPAAEALMKRALKKGEKEGFSFSMDQRLKFGVRVTISEEQHMSIISKIQCPVLLVITNLYVSYVESRKGKYDWKTLEFFKQKSNFQIVYVDGHHDVHNNEPDVVAPHVYKFLLCQKSFL